MFNSGYSSFSFRALPLTTRLSAVFCVALLCGFAVPLSAQSVSFAGPNPSVNFGTLNVCAPGQTTPAPCNATLTLTYNVTGSGTLGTPKVLTLGAPDLDFALASGSTCTGSVIQGNTCIVKVKFAPLHPGARNGAVEIVDGSGTVLANTYIYGTGTGPQIGFSSTLQTALGSGFDVPFGIAVDASDNLFVVNNIIADNSGEVWEILAAGGYTTINTLGSGFSFSEGPAVDGSGNVFVADINNNAVYEMPPGCASSSCVTTLGGGFNGTWGEVVDGSGNVFVSDAYANQVEEMPPGCASSSCVTTLGGGFKNPAGVAVDASGNVYVADTYNNAVKEMPPGCASSSCVTTLGGGFNQPEGVAVDASGNVFTNDYGNNAVKEIVAAGGYTTVNTLASGFAAVGLALDGSGNLFVTDYVVGGPVVEIPRSQPPVLSFGAIVPGSTATLPLTIINTGTGTLTFTPSINNPAFKIVTPEQGTCLTGITSAQSCTLQVEFSPTAPGVQNGLLSLQTNGATNSTVSLQGAGNVDFSGGFSGAGAALQLNGGAAIVNNILQLTNGELDEATSAFAKTPVDIQAFTTDFTFQILKPAGEGFILAGDGFTFAIQNSGPGAVGQDGGGLGYGHIRKSVAIKFDIYNNLGEGTDSTGLYTDGASPTIPAVDLSGSGINLGSGDSIKAHITYDGTWLTMTLTDTSTLATWSNAWAIDIPATVGETTAYVGFTAATGGRTSTETIGSWSYVAGPPPPNYPLGILDSTGLEFNGSASYQGPTLLLTGDGLDQAGSVFYTTPQNVKAFTTDFSFQLAAPNADGFTFTIQNEGSTALGGIGGSLGYAGISKSVAVKFDLYNNEGEGVDSTGLYTDGAGPFVPAVDLSNSGINLHTEDFFATHIAYDGTNLTLTITDFTFAGPGPSFSHSWPIDIPGTVGGPTAYVGFTGATGALTCLPMINTWTYLPAVQ